MLGKYPTEVQPQSGVRELLCHLLDCSVSEDCDWGQSEVLVGVQKIVISPVV